MLVSKLALLVPMLAFATATSHVSFYTDDLDMFGRLDNDFVSHLLSGWDAMDMQLGSILFHYPLGDNDTATQSQVQSRDLVSRVPVAECDSPNCYSSSKYQFFTRAQQEFIAGKLCPFVATAAPNAAVGSLTVIGIAAHCAAGINSCTLIAGAIYGTAGAYVTAPIVKALSKPCAATMAAIESSCGDLGGTATCSDSGKAVTYKLEAEATDNTCPAQNKCDKITCNSANANCQKYRRWDLM